MFGFFKYKKQEAQIKRAIEEFLQSGMSLHDAITRHLTELNDGLGLGLSQPVIRLAANTVHSLSSRTDAANVVEVYATVLYRYVFRNGTAESPGKLDEARFSYAIEHLDLAERGGYYVVKPDFGQDIDLKYPPKR